MHVGTQLVFSQGCEVAFIARQCWQLSAVPHKVPSQIFLLSKLFLAYWAQKGPAVVILHVLSQILFPGCRKFALRTGKASTQVTVHVCF